MEELLNICKEFISWLITNKKTRDDAISILKKNIAIPVGNNHKILLDKLPGDYKNLIISYTYPREIGDYKLPQFIQQWRCKNPQQPLKSNITEAGIIIEAYRGPVYRRFIRHLMWGFCKNSNGEDDISKIQKVQPREDIYSGCPICGEHHLELPHFQSTDSPFTICDKCIMNLITVGKILDIFEPNFIFKWD